MRSCLQHCEYCTGLDGHQRSSLRQGAAEESLEQIQCKAIDVAGPGFEQTNAARRRVLEKSPGAYWVVDEAS